MRLVANIPIRNADWVMGLSVRVALKYCDSAVLTLHACADRSAEIAAEISRESPGRVAIIADDDPKWDEMRFRQRMLEASRRMGATHIAIVDADEVLTANMVGQVRRRIEAAPAGALVSAPLYNLRGGIRQYHGSGIWGNRHVTFALADRKGVGWEGDLWHRREPFGALRDRVPLCQHGLGGVLHVWGASERRLRAHHAHYKLVERQRWPAKPVADVDAMYSWAIRGRQNDRPENWSFVPVPEPWWEGHADLLRHLDPEAEPWEEAACRAILSRDPGIGQGLDLFGVCA